MESSLGQVYERWEREEESKAPDLGDFLHGDKEKGNISTGTPACENSGWVGRSIRLLLSEEVFFSHCRCRELFKRGVVVSRIFGADFRSLKNLFWAE